MPRRKSDIDNKAGKLPITIYIVEEVKTDSKKTAAHLKKTLQDFAEPIIEKALVKAIEKEGVCNG